MFSAVLLGQGARGRYQTPLTSCAAHQTCCPDSSTFFMNPCVSVSRFHFVLRNCFVTSRFAPPTPHAHVDYVKVMVLYGEDGIRSITGHWLKYKKDLSNTRANLKCISGESICEPYHFNVQFLLQPKAIMCLSCSTVLSTHSLERSSVKGYF